MVFVQEYIAAICSLLCSFGQKNPENTSDENKLFCLILLNLELGFGKNCSVFHFVLSVLEIVLPFVVNI